MSFWESVKAGFLGAAGVDYYAKKTREEVRGLREDLSETINPWDDATAVQAAFAQIHAGIVELHEAMVTDTLDELKWHARISLAFVDLVDVLDRVERAFPTPSNPRSEAMVLLGHQRRAMNAFREGARLWSAQEFEQANAMVAMGKREWNALNDEVDRLSGQ